MADELKKKLEDLTEADLKKVVGGFNRELNPDDYKKTDEECLKCGCTTPHVNGECTYCLAGQSLGGGSGGSIEWAH